MIFSAPPAQLGQVCMSMSKTRLSSRAQLIRCGRGTGARRVPFGRSGGEPLHELQRAHDPVGRSVTSRRLEIELDLAGGVELHPFV